MLQEMGVDAHDIQHIVLTHAHFDHMGAISQFPLATLYIQKAELLSWYEAVALPKRFNYLTMHIDPDNLCQMLDASIAHRVVLIDGDKNDVLPGIHVKVGSGHTIAQQFVIVETNKGRRVVSGDCVYSRICFHGHNNDCAFVPLNNAIGSVWEQLKTIDRMNDEMGGNTDHLILQHDSDRWKGHPIIKEIEGFRIIQIA
jgi:glyoxylase-like metal-dependent hydrolase (beta-lactamase superfamily II)